MLMTFGWAFISILLVVIALCSLIILQPKSLPGIGSYWALSFLGQAFAPQLGIMCILLITAAIAFSAPAMTGIAGITGLLLYSYIYRQGRETQTRVNSVVNNAIAQLKLPEPTSTETPTKQFLPTGFRPLKFNYHKVTRTRNIPYGPHGNSNLLDIYQPRVLPHSPMPVLVFVPGGGWVTGSKNDQGLPLLNHLAAKGWLCIAINYRLGPTSRFPAMLEDIFNATHWVKTRAHEYGGDPEFIALAGNSAGGHLSSITALSTPQVLTPLGLNFPEIKINVVVSIYGRYDFLNRHQILPGAGLEPFLVDKVMPCPPADNPELWNLASPECLVHADAPPFLIIHGTADAMIPVQEARAFYTALRQVSNQAVDYLELAGAQHAYDLVCSSWAMPTVHGISDYLTAHYQKYQQSIQNA